MHIGILTYYGVHNHGAVLQANALKTVLEDLGHNVEFLLFDRDYAFMQQEQVRKYKIGFNSIPFYLKYTLRNGLGNVAYNYKKRRTLDTYRKDHLILKTNYKSFDGDVIVIGSDEVYSLEVGFNPMLFGIGLKSKKKISYAASFGPTDFTAIKKLCKEDTIAKALNQMNCISVRDLNSQALVKQLTGMDVPIVCDPVILYGYKREMGEKIGDDSNFILVYAYDGRMNDVKEVELVKEFAKKHGKKLYSVGFYHKWCDKNINVTPNQLIQYVRKASLVITDTFHGSVLSIICNTPMTVKVRNNANKLKYLLLEYGLADRIISDFGELEKVSVNNLDFDAVNKRIDEKRKFSFNYLSQALEMKNVAY